MIPKKQVRLSFLLGLLLASILPVYISYAASTTIAVNPQNIYVNIGATFSVDINITNVSNLASWQFKLYFLNSIVNCTGVTEGSFLNSVGGTFFNENVTNNFNGTYGRILAYCSIFGASSANGSGVLARAYFQSLEAGDSSLQLSETKLYDANMPPMPIDHNDVDGAVHVQTFLLTISTLGQGYVSPNNTGPYNYGDAVLLTAFPAVGWSFSNWSGSLIGSVNPAVVVITGNMSVTATFTQNAYTLSVFVSGSGSVNLNNSGPYNYGDSVLLTAMPSTGWRFDHWSGDLAGSANPATLIIIGNMGVNASFVAINYTLTTSVSPSGAGYVSLNNTGPYHYGDSISASAVSSVGWYFDHWSGNLVGNANPAILVILGNMSVTANFIENAYTLAVSTTGQGYVTLNNTAQYYNYGDAILLTAVPFVSWLFNHWSGNLTGTANPATLVMTANMSVTAIFTQNIYTLSVFVSGNGSVSLNNSGPYNYGDAVLLTAVPSTAWSFDHWIGDLTGSANPTALSITGNMSVTATFVQSNYTLNIYTWGNGTVSLNNTGPYHYGDAVLLTALPDPHWLFNYWSGSLAGTANPAVLVILGNMVVTAYFQKMVYVLTVNVNGGGSVILNNSGPYFWGDVVQLTANASLGWNFQCWSGDLSGTANPTTILINGNKVVNANFTVGQYALNVQVVGNGSVILKPNSAYYNYGDNVTLTAVASSGWSFNHWSGNLTGSSNPRYLYMYGNASVTATFVQINYTLTVHVIRLGSVSLNGTAPYHYGDTVLMVAVPNPGYGFDDWVGDLNSSSNPATLIITKNMDVTAWFVQNTYTLSVNVFGRGNVTMNSTGPYNYGDAVLLTAVSGTPWILDHWSGSLTGSTNPATLVITANVSVTANFIVEPTLLMSPNNITCRVYGESFVIALNVSDAVNIESFAFEIQYNTTLLDYVTVTWNAWGAGTATVNESGGLITGSTSGDAFNGTQTLITLEFKAAYYHVWKSNPDWTNDLTDAIFFQSANLSSPSGTNLTYERGGLRRIDVGPDYAYTFSPIQGDVNNDGTVDVFDLRIVGAYYGTKVGDPNWAQASNYDLDGDGVITTYDLELVATNYDFTYSP